MNPDTKYISIGLFIGGVIAAVIMMGAFFAGLLPPKSFVPTAQVEIPESISFALEATPTITPMSEETTSLSFVNPTPNPELILSDEILQSLPDYGGDWNIIIREDGDHTIFLYNADQRVHIASIFKIPIAMLFFKSLEKQGVQSSEYADYLSTRGIGRTYMQLLKAMLVNSEEAATGTLRGVITESKLDINAVLQSWGVFNTDVADIESRHSTSEDIATLYESLYFGNAIAPEGRQIILNLMSTYTPNDDTRLGVLRPLLPMDGMFYNKRGTVTDGRLIVGDSALLTWNQNGKEKVYVIVILSYHGELPTTDRKLERGIEEIARLFWDFAASKNP